MLMMLPVWASAAKTCGVTVKFDPSEIKDWADLDGKGVYLYDVDGANFIKTALVDSLSSDTMVYYYGEIKVPNTFYVTYGDKDIFAQYPMFRSVEVELKKDCMAALYKMTPGTATTEITDWYTRLELIDEQKYPDDTPVMEPYYDKNNYLSYDEFNFNETQKWYYAGWNNGGGTAASSLAAPGYAESAGALCLHNEKQDGTGWYAQALFDLSKPVPAGKYKLSFYAKSDVKGAQVEMGIKNSDGWPNTYETYAGGIELATDWNLYEFFIATEKETSILEFNHGFVTGNVYLDCIVLVPAVEPAYNEANILPEGDYNFNETQNWYYLGWNNGGGKAKSSIATPGYAYSAGALCLYNENKQGDPWGAQVLYNLPSAIPAGQYTLSFWAKSDVEGAPIQCGIKNNAGWPDTYETYADGVELTTAWTKYQFTLSTTEATHMLEINHGHVVGNVFIDCMSLTRDIEPYDSRNALPEGDYNFNEAQNWYYAGWNNGGGSAKASVGTPGWMMSDGALCLHNEKQDGTGWYAQALYNLPKALPAGEYAISFWAKTDADEANGAQLGIKNSAGWPDTYESYGPIYSLTKEWTKYEFTIVTEKETSMLEFNHGFIIGNVFIDALEVINAATPKPVPGETIVYTMDLNAAAVGGFPAGWKAVDNGNTQEYPNTYGSGPRTFDGFSGDFTRALYWRETAGNGYLSYGEQSEYKLHLVAGEYAISFTNLSWKNFDQSYTFTISGNGFSKTKEYVAPANPNGSDAKGEIAGYPGEEIKFYIPAEGDYVVKFTCPASWNGYILFAFKVAGYNLETPVGPEPTEEPNVEGNLLDDASYNFNNGTVGQWKSVGSKTAAVFAEAPGYDGSAYCMKATTAEAGESYATQLCFFTELEVGHTYAYSFVAKSEGDGKVQVCLQQAADPWAGDYGANISLTNEWAAYSGEITVNNADETRFLLNIGEVAADYFFDRVALVDVTGVGIKDAPIVEKTSVIYNTLGQRVMTPVNGEIYVIDGKKVMYNEK